MNNRTRLVTLHRSVSCTLDSMSSPSSVPVFHESEPVSHYIQVMHDQVIRWLDERQETPLSSKLRDVGEQREMEMKEGERFAEAAIEVMDYFKGDRKEPSLMKMLNHLALAQLWTIDTLKVLKALLKDDYFYAFSPSR